MELVSTESSLSALLSGEWVNSLAELWAVYCELGVTMLSTGEWLETESRAEGMGLIRR